MPSIVIFINHDAHEELLETPASNHQEHAKKLENFFKAAASGHQACQIEQISDDTALVRASATLTCASVVEDNTCVINGVTLIAKASPAGESQFLVEATNTLQAATIAAAINAHSSLVGIVTASSSGAVVTVSAASKGLIGNAITLVGTVTVLAASAARLAGGTGMGEAPVNFSFGKA